MEGSESHDFGDLVRQRKQPVDARTERNIVTGMIISDRFLREVQPLLLNSRFQADFAGEVAGWCSEYWHRYRKAPGRDIEEIFLQHQTQMDEERAELIRDFLAGLSDEYERSDIFNHGYMLDIAERYFHLVGLKTLNEQLSKAIKAGRPEEGEAFVRKYQRPERTKARGVDPLRDMEFIMESTRPQEDNPDVLLIFPGALGLACGPLERGFLIAFLAESGVGKTWWLWFLIRLAVFRGLNSVFMSMEMKETKMGRRMWQDLTGSPSKGKGEVLIPVFDCRYNQDGSCGSPKREGRSSLLLGGGKMPERGCSPKGYISCSSCRDDWDISKMTTWWKVEQREILDPAVAIRKHDIMERMGELRKAGKLHLVEFPTDSLTADGMVNYVNNLEYYDSLMVDLLVTDYADKCKLDSKVELRRSIDKVWATHKSLAQEKHCLVATASQSNTERSGKKVGKSSWAESIEKRRGIDLGIAMNQTEQEREKGLIFLEIDKIRHEERTFAVVAVLQQLAIGRPYIDSCFVKRKKESDGDE